MLCQLALGAAFRHRALDVVPHVLGAAVVTGIIAYSTVFLLMHYPRHGALRTTAGAVLAITLAQVFLGVAAYMSRMVTTGSPQPMPVMVWFTVAHVALGAVTMAASVVLAIQVYRNVRRPMQEAPEHGLAVVR